ncbi:MAG TPA: 50S ribosomal protein L13 [Gordonia sp. (in: high G+C Gram-positive bacteria)]|uniref:50S ribosomal protein L13 n=1 Tax=unclassified Gordonia (in: high G+C Gram-positive bacteria) TaxID=2657482 RepID=UPI000FB1E5C5|nr:MULTISPECIES: 50S ribosomal protein L13 [unclassified Gordonia (in: high G+C Gram-positive bacteria)]RUP37790.1 MAG: 50S ribosomal protein L13 [Gordonia sp. (in: high G+C Gram-positive bacteria)]HNP55354.1 50S ribosomal protein L13 [Gordonia sp. (in: high G+C Gram-positive bacteria)]HRC50074.1 50S ribosomal protein L13 [Gordonia sp. (in: high G+C Gram-positive bacteria)]
MSTYTPKAGDITRTWHVIDATDVVLGRLAVQSATLLRGKHKPTYAPHIDGGDFVIVVNADKVAITGNKASGKMKYRHSGHPGGLKSTSLGDLLATKPERAVEQAIKGMLPKNKLGRAMGSKLKVYAGPNHPHAAQRPVPFEIKQVAQ